MSELTDKLLDAVWNKKRKILDKEKKKFERENSGKEIFPFFKECYQMLDAIEKVIPYIKENPGTIQTELKNIFSDIDYNAIVSVLYHYDKTGKIKREKTGHTYKLYVTKN